MNRNVLACSERGSSSVTHPSSAVSSRKFSAAARLLQIGETLNKIPTYIDPSMFSDDEDDDNDDKVEEEEEEEKVEDEEDGKVAETNEKVDAKKLISDGSCSQGRIGIKSESFATQRELLHSSCSRSADVLHRVRAVVPCAESYTKGKLTPFSTSRERTQEERFQNSGDFGSQGSKHYEKSDVASRALLKKQDNNTLEEFNWKNKVNKLRKIDELQSERNTGQINSKSSEVLVTSNCHLEKPKSHKSGDACIENALQGVNKHISTHSSVKQVHEPSICKEKPAQCISRGTSKSDENVDLSYRSSNPSSDTDEKSQVKSLMLNQVITVNKKPYLVLNTLGTGGSCKVYGVYGENKTVYALKCVTLGPGDKQIMDGYKKEIKYLKKLERSNRVIKMHDYEYLDSEIRLLLEKGDTDLAHYIANETKIKPLTPITIKYYWSQMLEAVADIHKLGIVHSDLKPSNFLLVAGQLKLIDFGIAASVPADMTSAIRESHVGTLNFISPEALTTHYTDRDNNHYVIKIGVKSDVWSLGCILYNMVYGHTPFSSIVKAFPKMRAILDDNYEILFPDIDDVLLLDVLKLCLKRNPKERASVEELLKHPYLTSEAEVPSTPLKSILGRLQSLTPGRMKVVTTVLEKLQSTKELQ